MKSYKREVKQALKKRKLRFVSTGSTLADCAISDKAIGGGLPLGTYTRVCGDSDAGKTWIVVAILAEAAINPKFDNYKLYYDAIEDGALMELGDYFGPELVKRIQNPPLGISPHVEGMYHNIRAASKIGPFIYVTDSMDALDAKADLKMDDENLIKYEKNQAGDKEKQSYGAGKARVNSKKLGPAVSRLKANNSLLVMVSQSRENIGAMGLQDKKTVSGGKAMIFHAAVTFWLSKKQTLKKKVGGKDRKIGIISNFKVVRTRVTGKKHTVEVPIIYGYGIDDITANINYLLEEKPTSGWSKSASGIKAKGLTSRLFTLPDLVSYIERKSLQEKLKEIVGKVWNEIQEGCKADRVNKYHKE